MLQHLILLAIAGAIGSLARFGLSGLVQKYNGVSFPWGTVVVNIAGCFLAGVIWTLFESKWAVSNETKAVVLIGFLGAFTTFSTLILETTQLANSSAWLHAAMNITLQTGLGFLALFAGASLVRAV